MLDVGVTRHAPNGRTPADLVGQARAVFVMSSFAAVAVVVLVPRLAGSSSPSSTRPRRRRKLTRRLHPYGSPSPPADMGPILASSSNVGAISVNGIRDYPGCSVWASTIVLLTVWLARPSGQVSIVAIDEGHFNVHTAATTYRDLADAIRQDGFRVDALASRFTRELLAPIAVLVVSNARAAASGPLEARGRRAFMSSELDAIVDWVRRGGGLLLVVDHYPIGGANRELGGRFGVDIRNGYTSDPPYRRHEVAGQVALSAGGTVTSSEQIIFERAANALGDHVITCGRTRAERVDRVATFGGTSFDAPRAAVPLLRFSASAIDAIGPARTRRSAAGRNQGLALPFGEGRVVFLGEAAMLTNIDQPAVQNRQFALNVVRWLAGRLNDTGATPCGAG